MVVEIENERGRVRRTLGLVGWLLLAGALPAFGQPAADQIEVAGVAFSVEVERHNGYEAIAWSRVPESVVSGSFQRDGSATGQVAGTSLELRSGSPFGRYGDSVFQLSNPPYRLQGEVWVPLELLVEWLPRVQPKSASVAPAAATPEVAQPIPAAATVDERPTPGSRRPGPWRVVIDAGHGGVDPGTMSPRTGVREKDITLSVAKKLAAELERRGGIEPLLTRDRDVFVEVMERPSLAVEWEADLFLSIHVDAQPGGRSSARGFTTYHLGQARTEDALAVARRENAVIELEEGAKPPNLQQLEIILATVDRDAYRRESRLLAGHIQNGLRGAMDTQDRGARQGPYYVLMTPGLLPAVLVELGYITNRADEAQLKDPERQDRIARALADTIENFLEDTGRRIAATEGRG
ncbi:MAG: N-acetylmuramoyl-L-alanine amidase [marine benthic group bacterium]|nr:N-acetylmuramoyl-L-alanine amidase [Gemmatimonadota bacterium]